MNRHASRLLWIGLGLAVLLVMVWERLPLPDASGRLDRLPKAGLGFASRELPLTESERAIFGAARSLKRLYQAGSQRLVVQVIDGTRNRHAVHDPLYCLRGAGWEVRHGTDIAVPGGTARLLSLEGNGRTAEALYWFSDGQTRHASAPRYWAQTTGRRLTRGRSGEEPVLTMVQPWDGEPVNWEKALQKLPMLFEF